MKRQSAGIGGYETAVVVVITVIISTLSVCAAFLIYRAVKGQRGEKSSDNHAGRVEKEAQSRGDKDDEEEEEEDWSKSTEIDEGTSNDEVDSSESIILSAASDEQTPLDLLQENPPTTAHVTLKEPTIEHAAGETCEPEEGHMKCKAADDVIDYSMKESAHEAEEFENEPHVDNDEPSETESAQETMEVKNVPVYKSQSVEDLLDNTLLTQEVVNKSSEKEELILANPVLSVSSDAQQKKMDGTGEAHEVHEIVRHIPQSNDTDSCRYEQPDMSCNLAKEKAEHKEDIESKQDLSDSTNSLEITNESMASQQHPGNKYDHLFADPKQSYLGFATPDLPADSPALPRLADSSRKRTEDAPVEVSKNKNEISIMEAIMDSNEWLSAGPPDTRDVPWISQSQNNTSNGFKADTSSSQAPAVEEKRSHQEKTGVSMVSPVVIGDKGDLVNKIVGAVSPMPQLIRVSFRVHYITHSPYQILAVTGNQQELGSWESFVPLRSVEDGFWFRTIELPLDSQVEWKFVVVEEGKIRRWEECGNRHLVVTGQDEEILVHKNWGYA